ncbi:hypothetical protein OS493_010414 [Desmophyllum pertusum]|uniref:Uncharacterized protein n=1 Tax=Desmophyllum pertusum TaxID=174260 RepID=A0A9X0DC98_9CNID|nr:hypothetical protein OS493_010414 [Desmophyllum pertusum]
MWIKGDSASAALVAHSGAPSACLFHQSNVDPTDYSKWFTREDWDSRTRTRVQSAALGLDISVDSGNTTKRESGSSYWVGRTVVGNLWGYVLTEGVPVVLNCPSLPHPTLATTSWSSGVLGGSSSDPPSLQRPLLMRSKQDVVP